MRCLPPICLATLMVSLVLISGNPVTADPQPPTDKTASDKTASDTGDHSDDPSDDPSDDHSDDHSDDPFGQPIKGKRTTARRKDNSRRSPSLQAIGWPETSSLSEKLNTRMNLEFQDTSLADACDIISERIQVNLYLDPIGLDDIGLDSNAPINLSMRNVPLEFGLRQILRQHDLNYVEDESGVIVVTSRERAESMLTSLVYPVHDLDNEGPPYASADALIDAITTTTAPETWEELGGPGSIAYFRGTLIITQSAQVHRKIQRLLSSLRKGIALGGERPDNGHPQPKAPHREPPIKSGGMF